jgi:glycosyltransferase involved in cell wall biosynthesis
MKILIATPTYHPDHGGPAYYAKSLKEEFEKLGHVVVVRKYGFERRLPSWVKHFVYCLKTAPAYLRADLVILLDHMIVGFPVAMLKTFFGGKVILRVGGDFLWEWYVERTEEKILLSEFYEKPRPLTLKEKVTFKLTKFVLRKVTNIVFNTNYQKDIWVSAYNIDPKKVSVIENRYEPVKESHPAKDKTFVYAAARPLVWKNADVAREAFGIAEKSIPDARIEFLFDLHREAAIEKIKDSYACILTSLGDLGPNYILRALSFGKPVILSQEIGIRERIGDVAMYVDPRDPAAIARAIVAMSNETTYAEYRRRVAAFMYTHTYADIAREFLALHP